MFTSENIKRKSFTIVKEKHSTRLTARWLSNGLFVFTVESHG